MAEDFNNLFNMDAASNLFGDEPTGGDDLFSLGNDGAEETAKPEEKKADAEPKKEAAPKKEVEPKKDAAPKKEEAAPKKEEAKKEPAKNKSSDSKAKTPDKKKLTKSEMDNLRVGPTWTIAYAAQVFTPPEVDMTLEQVREYMEQDYPEFSSSRTKWEVDEDKHLLVPVIHSGKMG